MNSKLAAGLGLLTALIMVAIFAPFLAPQNPDDMSLPESLAPPSLHHPLGQDENGGDVLSKLIYGARISLGVAGTVMGVSVIIGLLIGSVAGYCGGWIENLCVGLMDMVYAFPSFLLALSLVAVLGGSVRNLILALCLTSWTSFARLVRGEVLRLKAREHVHAARALGASHWRIVMVHIWPNLLGLVAVQSTFATAATILSESGLSFLGLGVPPSTPTWGSLLNSGRRTMSEAPHIGLSAGLAIVITVMAFNLLGDGLQSLLDPRQDVESI